MKIDESGQINMQADRGTAKDRQPAGARSSRCATVSSGAQRLGATDRRRQPGRRRGFSPRSRAEGAGDCWNSHGSSLNGDRASQGASAIATNERYR